MVAAFSWTNFLLAANDLTLAAIVVVGFSLFAYIALHNWRNGVARSFCLLIVGLMIVLGGAILQRQAQTEATRHVLWRIQWAGISLVPAAYYHFAESLLRSTGDPRMWTRVLLPLFYTFSVGFWLVALTSNLLVIDVPSQPYVGFGKGPLFWFFISYFVAVCSLGVWCIRQAHRRSITPANRRRLWYLSTSFLAPFLGVFPYLIIAANTTVVPSWLSLMLLGASTTGVGVMMTLMTYSVAFHGVIVPDRLVKYNFLRYILYGPVVGVALIICLQLVEPLSASTGLPRATITIFGVMLMTVVMPIFIGRIRPTVDTLIYRQDSDEVRWMRRFEERAFTRQDLRQLLENTLVAVCGSLRVESGFVLAPNEDQFTVQASCGPRRTIKQFLNVNNISELLQSLPHGAFRNDRMPEVEDFSIHDGFCLLPLYNSQQELLGAIGIGCKPEQLTIPTRQLIATLAHQMELALTHMQLQQNLFSSLRGLAPQSASLLQLTSEIETPASEMADAIADVALHPEFPQLVKDALSHYWGGPKLSDSPLLDLRTVRQLLNTQGGSPTRALQGVLRQAIENIRPEDQLDPSAPEWMIYNILELRFLKGLRIREIIDKLAMSESDFYRKQRVAVEEVARQLALMEDQGDRPAGSVERQRP
ncbi:histidine kinase N-terminal 7TM domain-containing protein [Herpetosiphon sp. NSE202]|uniref:histidine kinase N-terminal 7TM domain-containing protein n=1 Tax=Herpetosiphon sp. NSE202 TaxID=3351349 RepID=UPI003624E086